MKKIYYVKEIIQSKQISSIENDGPYYDTVLDVDVIVCGHRWSKREIIRKRFNKIKWDELVEKRYFSIEDNEEPLPEEIENSIRIIEEFSPICTKEELKKLILYSAALINERKAYDSKIADLRKRYNIGCIEQLYPNKEVKNNG